MENFKGEPDWERSSTSRGLNTTCIVAPSGRLGLAGGGASSSRDEEAEGGRNLGRLCEGEHEFIALGKTRTDSGELAGETTSLREWLDRPERRPIELLDCLHIFRQIAEDVGLAHSQGVVVHNIQPSCFVMSPFSRITFIDSASCSSSDSDSLFEDGDVMRASSAKVSHMSSAENLVVNEYVERKEFPLKQTLVMEFNWYTSPEEVPGGPSTFASDIYRLGVLLFELFCKFDSQDEKLRTMSNLRHRILPPQMLLKWPKVASFCLWLLHPLPDARPKMSEVLQSEFLNETRDSLEEREAATKLREEIEEQEMLLEFLLRIQQRKQEMADKLHDTVSLLSADIEEVSKRKSTLTKQGDSYSELGKTVHSSIVSNDQCMFYPATTRKRFRVEHQNNDEEERNKDCAEGPKFNAESEIQENALSRNSRLMNNFRCLESAYISTRCSQMKPSSKSVSRKAHVTNTARGSTIRTEGSSVVDSASKVYRTGWIDPFLEGLCKYLSFSKLNVRAVLKQGDLLNLSNLVCSLGFDRDKEFFATAGVNKKIKIFECDVILNANLDIHYPVVELASRSKISSICWNNYIKSQIASSDFDGVVQVWDVTKSQVLVKMREHEKRVWSVDFSLSDPTKLASGSDDGTVKLWNINQGGSIGTIRTKANVCSVQFPPDSSRSLAIGSADHKVYCYDLRNLRVPWCTLVGHTKTVSYVKFVDPNTIVSASTDNSLKLWDLSLNKSSVMDCPLQTFTGHTNVKNFVGLSISDGYIATGSETNEVFVYHKSFPMPVLSYKFNSEEREVNDGTQFISCMCWLGQSSTLLAANSSGNVKLLEMA